MTVNNYYTYIHIPFCSWKCRYCNFASVWSIDNLKIQIYISHLLKEIKLSKISIWNLKSIYLWWWTPSILTYLQIKSIIEELKLKYIFDKDIEISIESIPWDINLQKLIEWESLGINRLSIGIQTLNNKSLEEIWRWKKWDILDTLSILENSKTKLNISFDFIIWLAYVWIWEIQDNIDFIIKNYDFNLNHISVYLLEDYYNKSKIKQEKSSKYKKIFYPDIWKKLWIKERSYLKEYISIKKYLETKWFFAYEISNFSKIWYQSIHNKAYWNHSEILAFWLWASSYIWWERKTSAQDFTNYYKWNYIEEEKLSDNDIFLEKLMFWLRTNGLNKDLYQLLDQEKILYFIKLWYIKKDSDILKLSDKWILVLDYILKEL